MECWLLQKKAVLPLLLFSLLFSPSLVAEPALANVKLPSIFSDDMVLQANAPMLTYYFQRSRTTKFVFISCHQICRTSP